jgi:hypothetical protein
MLLGSGCLRPFSLGYDYCPIQVKEPMPKLTLHFLNPAEYAVSNCHLGIHKRGKIDVAGSVEIDLTELAEETQRNRFCLLRIEAIERYHDPKDYNQLRQIPLTGGFFIEVLDKEYFPTPTDPVVSWCYKVKGTNKGRRSIEECPL